MEHKVSSTTSLFSDEVHHYQAEPEPEAEPPQPERDLFSLDEIVDLVGGAQDALNRHMAEDDSPQEFTQVLDSLPEDLVTWAEPEPVPEEQPGLPDSTSPPLVSAPVLVPSPVAEEPKVIAPTAEPESTRIESEPRVEPAPEPSPENDALPAAAAPAEESERPTVTEEAPAAPASCECLSAFKQPEPNRDRVHQFVRVVGCLNPGHWNRVNRVSGGVCLFVCFFLNHIFTGSTSHLKQVSIAVCSTGTRACE